MADEPRTIVDPNAEGPPERPAPMSDEAVREYLAAEPGRTKAGYLMSLLPERLGGESVALLEGAAAATHREMEESAKVLAEVTKRVQSEMGAAQERFRRAMAAHLAAITGEQVTP